MLCVETPTTDDSNDSCNSGLTDKEVVTLEE